MAESEAAYPLEWPDGYKRTKNRTRALFRMRSSPLRISRALSIDEAIDRLSDEIARIPGKSAILSSNLLLRKDGWPRSGQSEPDDTGVAVYFTRSGVRIALACDKWDRAADNVAALASHIRALRGQERWGVGTMEQAFRGYRKLPPPGSHAPRKWRQVFLVNNGDAVSLDTIKQIYRAMAKEVHPDQGGNDTAMAELNAAFAEAKQELEGDTNG